MTISPKQSTETNEGNPPEKRRSPLRWLSRLLWRSLLVVSLLFFWGFVIISYTPLGVMWAKQFYHTPRLEELKPADAIVVLGGDPYRAVDAAVVFKRKLAPRIIVSGDVERNRHTLKICGIPPEAIESESLCSTTADHPYTIQTLPNISCQSQLIIVTNGHHPSRAKMLFSRAGYQNIQLFSMESTWWDDTPHRKRLGSLNGIEFIYSLLAYAKDYCFSAKAAPNHIPN